MLSAGSRFFALLIVVGDVTVANAKSAARVVTCEDLFKARTMTCSENCHYDVELHHKRIIAEGGGHAQPVADLQNDHSR